MRAPIFICGWVQCDQTSKIWGGALVISLCKKNECGFENEIVTITL